VRHLVEPERLELARQHTSFHTFAENIGQPGCDIPDDGLTWKPTRQPIALGAWPVTPGPADGPLTTVMQWESYPARTHGGQRYGLKSDSFPAFLDLPARTGARFELAIGGPGPALDLLAAHGWRVRDPRRPTRDPWTYQGFIQRSRAEFSVAKQAYVCTRSGWFSERSAAYLASGRPVVVQDTGLSDWLGPRTGVFPFTTEDEAVAGISELTADYPAHCRGARATAEDVFDARTVLTGLLDDALALDGGAGTATAPQSSR